jgi:DNA polymerase-3 subunit delta
VAGARATGASRRGAEPPRAVSLILGDEPWLAAEALRRLVDRLLPAADRQMGLDVLDAGETAVQEIIGRCETLPFFGSRRVVVVKRGEALRPQDQDALAAYLDGAPPPSTLIIVAEKLDGRRRLWAVLKRIARIIPCQRLEPPDLLRWVRAQAAAEGKTIAPEAAEALLALTGAGLAELHAEIGKLAAYTGARGTITAADVHEVTSHTAEATVFELMDAVGQRQPAHALRLLQRVLADEAPVKVLFMIGDQVRMLLRTQALQERSGGRRVPGDVARAALGTRAFLYDRYRAQLAAFGRMDAERMLQLLLDADTEIKTGGTPPRLALETLIVGLCL